MRIRTVSIHIYYVCRQLRFGINNNLQIIRTVRPNFIYVIILSAVDAVNRYQSADPSVTSTMLATPFR